jgi:hypothetical protein
MNITYKIAMAAGQDAGNRSMQKAGRKAWNADDFAAAAEVTRKLLGAE